MKYKYSRKECNKEIETIKIIFSGSQIMPGGWLETVTQYLHATQLMLLAQKEDKKECKHKAVWSAEDNKYYCFDCGINLPTPSPLEIEDIEEIHKDKNITVNFATKRDLALAIMKTQLKTNSLIRNQKKLYQFIKEKL